jgi:hypothetical protein
VNVLLGLCLVASVAATWGLIRLGKRLWARFHPGCCASCGGTGVSGDYAVPGGRCWDCRGTGHPHESSRRASPAALDEPRSADRPLPGAAEGGSTYQHDEDDWFDERLRPAHPDRPDEDY